MNTRDFIKNFRKTKKLFERRTKRYQVAGEPMVECADAEMLRGKYAGMRLSDVFIIDPGYLDYLINAEGVDQELKEIAREVKRNQSYGSDSISRDIALR